MSKLTQARLKEVLKYDKRTGVFTWKVKAGPRSKGQVAGNTCSSSGYVQITVHGKNYRAHRLAWLYVKGEWPPRHIDHEDRIRTNNRWANLRLATRKQNAENMGVRRDNASGAAGVSWDPSRDRWCAYLKHNGRKIHLGRHIELENATAARKAAEKLYFTHAPA